MDIEQNIKNILLVEDNQKYANAALQYLGAQEYTITHVRDYTEAMTALQEQRYDGIVTDCFFPEKTGSKRTELGVKLLDEILEIKVQLVKDEERPDFDYISKKVYNMIEYGKEAIVEDEANQPLGILIGQKAEKLGIPFVIATSSYHHDTLTQPVHWYISRDVLYGKKEDELFQSNDEQKINQYITKVGKIWKLVDCDQNNPEAKASEQFWNRVHTELETRIVKAKSE